VGLILKGYRNAFRLSPQLWLSAGGGGKAEKSGPHPLLSGSGDLAGLGQLFGALAHKVYKINRSFCLINTISAQFGHSS
jgi:hypothetical protein